MFRVASRTLLEGGYAKPELAHTTVAMDAPQDPWPRAGEEAPPAEPTNSSADVLTQPDVLAGIMVQLGLRQSSLFACVCTAWRHAESGADAAATTMLLFGNDSHHTSESAVQHMAFTFAQKTVSVFASPVSSDAYVKAFLPPFAFAPPHASFLWMMLVEEVLE